MTTSALDLRLESLLGSGAIPVLGEVVEGARPTGVAPANEARATASVWGLSAEDKDVSPEEHRDLSSSTHTPRAGNPPAYLLSVSDFPLGGDDFGRPSPAYSRLSYTFDNPAILRGENHEDHAATMSQDFYIRSQRNDPRTPSPRSQASLQHGRPQHAGKMRSQATMGPEPDPHMKENDDNPPELYHDRDMWDMYLDQAFPEDKETSDGWDSDLDSMLIFAAIFSAVLTAFVIESYQSLQPNSADTSVVLLQAILMGLQANSTPPLPAAVTSQFRPTGSAVRVNIYWFASLIISLSTALIAILAKQWVHFLHSGLSPVRETRVRQRQYRMDGLQKWRLPAVLSFLPVLLHIALLLFFAGLLDFAWSLNRAVAITSFILVFVTFLTYAAANVLPYIYPDCPYKTSVTAFISIVYGFLDIGVKQLAADIRMVWATLRICKSWLVRKRRQLRELLEEILDIWSDRAYFRQELMKGRISSLVVLKSQDEGFIAQYSHLLDSRALVWLIKNATRLEDAGELGRALIHFPNLVQYRRLFIDGGAIQFLEHLLHSHYVGIFNFLHLKKQMEAQRCMQVLAALVSEAEVEDSVESLQAVTDGASNTVIGVPYLNLRRKGSSSAVMALSPATMQLIVQCLGELDNLPLSSAAHVLRLSITLAEVGDGALWFNLDGEKVITNFHQRVATCEVEDTSLWTGELPSAVNTVIYIALWDVARMQRYKQPGDMVLTIHYWLNTFVSIMSRKSIDGISCRQICWAICSLSWALRTPNNGSVIEPLLPRLPGMHVIAAHFCSLLYPIDQDPAVLDAVLITIEGILYRCSSASRTDRRALCAALIDIYPGFLNCFRARVEGEFPGHPLLHITRNTVAITKISAYLAFHDQPLFPQHNEPWQSSLLRDTLILLRHICDPSEDAHTLPSTSARYLGASLQGPIYRWAYATACKLTMFHLKNPSSVSGPRPEEFDLVDVTHNTISSSFLDVIRSISSSADCSPGVRLAFFDILGNLFLRGTDKGEALKDSGAWSEDTITIIIDLVRHRVLEILLTLPGDRLRLLNVALDSICRISYAGDRPLIRGSRLLSRADPLHPSSRMARALRHTWIPFLGKFSEVVQIGVSRTLFVKLFASLIRISGQLAFFQYPREMPNERITHAMSDICTLVCNPISDRLLGMTTRRWAYGAMGSMALLYMSPSENIVLEQNPADYFTFERPLNERRSAIPLLRILSLDLVRRGVTFEPHCLDCTVDEFDSDLGLLIPGFMPVAALRTLIPLFGDDNEEAESLRNTLVIHGISDILVKYLLIPGEIGDLAKTILDQLPAYLNGDAPHAVSYSIAEEPS